ncbi:MAG: hypothetical protein EAZ61_07460 [Oscillatoriales cyanobacterium]|nr:MAG: hypothetical protein EAZ61_07460 [Oscillatoriales cyanobacterium]
METTVNCATECIDGCILGERCPNRDYAATALQFINDVSLETMHEIAEEAIRKKSMAAATEEPKWVIPDFLDT